MEGGGGASHAAQEPRELQRQGQGKEEEDKARRADGGGKGAGMKFRVSARAPHGVGALLLIGGAVLAGAAVVAWRHARRGRKQGGGRDRQPAKQEALDGGVAEGGKSGAPAQEIDRPDDNPRGDEDKTEIASNELDNGGVTLEIEEVHDDAEIVVADESNSERVEGKNDLDSGRSPTEISMHEDVDSEHVEKSDENSSSKLPEDTTHDMDNEIVVEKGDENSTKDDTENDDNSTKKNTENDDNSTKNDIQNDEDSVTNHIENENSIKEERTANAQDNEDVEASDQCSRSISHPVIVLHKQPSLHTDCAQEAESMENSPTAQLMMHQEQLLDDMTVDTEAESETAEAKLGEGTVVDKDACKQEEQKEIAEPVGFASSPALSSLVNPAEKKQPELPARVETGMKIEQDYTNGGLKEHGRISSGDVTTMDRRSPSMAILALMFVLTVGIAIAVRLYAPPRATKLQIDLQ